VNAAKQPAVEAAVKKAFLAVAIVGCAHGRRPAPAPAPAPGSLPRTGEVVGVFKDDTRSNAGGQYVMLRLDDGTYAVEGWHGYWLPHRFCLGERYPIEPAPPAPWDERVAPMVGQGPMVGIPVTTGARIAPGTTECAGRGPG
jgi:hypothetical protein